MKAERRKHVRVHVDCEMALLLNGDYLSCQIRNIASAGVLARVQSGDITQLEEKGEVVCWLGYQGKNFEAACRVIRVVESDVALVFFELSADQTLFLQEMIQDNGG